MALFNGTAEKKSPNGVSTTNGSVVASPEGATCIIAKGTIIEGKITTSENMRIDGTVKGEVHCEKRLVMDAGGLIEGNLHAGESTIKGRVVGTVTVANKCKVLATVTVPTTLPLIVDSPA